jgi:uncharacterized membrane protein YedE/YeeE
VLVNWVRANGHALRVVWAVAGVAAAVVLVFGSAADALVFSLAYGSHLGSYPGQAHDRQVAWQLLAGLAAAWVLVLAAMIWPAIRWRSRGMYSAPGEASEPDPASEPAR